MSALTNRVVRVLTDAHDLVFLLADREGVTGGNVCCQLVRRMLNNHLGEIRMCALVEQDDAAVRLEEFARQLADGRDRNFVFYTHCNASPDRNPNFPMIP